MDLVERSCAIIVLTSESFMKSSKCLSEICTAKRVGAKVHLVTLNDASFEPIDQSGVLTMIKTDPTYINTLLDPSGWEYLQKRGIYPGINSLQSALVAILENQPLVFASGASKSKRQTSMDQICNSLLPIRKRKAEAAPL